MLWGRWSDFPLIPRRERSLVLAEAARFQALAPVRERGSRLRARVPLLVRARVLAPVQALVWVRVVVPVQALVPVQGLVWVRVRVPVQALEQVLAQEQVLARAQALVRAQGRVRAQARVSGLGLELARARVKLQRWSSEPAPVGSQGLRESRAAAGPWRWAPLLLWPLASLGSTARSMRRRSVRSSAAPPASSTLRILASSVSVQPSAAGAAAFSSARSGTRSPTTPPTGESSIALLAA